MKSSDVKKSNELISQEWQKYINIFIKDPSYSNLELCITNFLSSTDSATLFKKQDTLVNKIVNLRNTAIHANDLLDLGNLCNDTDSSDSSDSSDESSEEDSNALNEQNDEQEPDYQQWLWDIVLKKISVEPNMKFSNGATLLWLSGVFATKYDNWTKVETLLRASRAPIDLSSCPQGENGLGLKALKNVNPSNLHIVQSLFAQADLETFNSAITYYLFDSKYSSEIIKLLLLIHDASFMAVIQKMTTYEPLKKQFNELMETLLQELETNAGRLKAFANKQSIYFANEMTINRLPVDIFKKIATEVEPSLSVVPSKIEELAKGDQISIKERDNLNTFFKDKQLNCITSRTLIKFFHENGTENITPLALKINHDMVKTQLIEAKKQQLLPEFLDRSLRENLINKFTNAPSSPRLWRLTSKKITADIKEVVAQQVGTKIQNKM